jgi:hypothetical protein
MWSTHADDEVTLEGSMTLAEMAMMLVMVRPVVDRTSASIECSAKDGVDMVVGSRGGR